MPGSLTLFRGSAGSGKSQLVQESMQAGEHQVVSDFSELWAAVRGKRRNPETGRYPIREDDDPAVETGLVAYLQTVVVRQALEKDLDVVVTSGSPDTVQRWQEVAEGAGASFAVSTIDPGRSVAEARLAIDGVLSSQCAGALSRWYG